MTIHKTRFLFGVVTAMLVASCGDKDIVDPGLDYLRQTSPENVLANLQTAYKARDIEGYSALLSDDYHFYFDDGTRQRESLPEFWLKQEDPGCTALLFDSPEVSDIRIHLTFGSLREAAAPGVVYLDVLDTFLEVDLVPSLQRPEGLTLRIDGQRQRFYFRKGRTMQDTDSDTWYIIEWRDYGVQGAPSTSAARTAVESTTWGAIKAHYCRLE